MKLWVVVRCYYVVGERELSHVLSFLKDGRMEWNKKSVLKYEYLSLVFFVEDRL